MKKIFLLAAIAALVSSCSNNEEQISNVPDKSALAITASIQGSVISRSEKLTWENNDKLGLFVCNSTLGNPYKNLDTYSNILFTYSASGWNSSQVTLDTNEGTVFAYYPYSATTDPKSISISAPSQVDYLYGTGDTKVSLSQRNVNITMNHALSQVVFKVKKSTDYIGNGAVTAVKLQNIGSATDLKTTGTLDISSGNVTGTASGEISLSANVTLTEVVQSLSAIVIPVSPTGDKNIKVIFTIDGVDLQYVFPAQTAWTAGKRNIYSLTLGSNGLQIGGADGSGVVITPWTDENQEDIQLEPIA